MKLSVSVLLFTLSLQASTAACQLIVLPHLFRAGTRKPAINGQNPIMNIPNILLPPKKDDDDGSSGGSNDLSISDVIGKERVINIFAGFTRDIDSISNRLTSNNQNTTVLAPLNSELQKLPRKPWEDPEDYNELGAKAYEGQSGEDRAQRNLRRFVQAHVIPVSPWKEREKVDSIGGGNLWWEEKDGKKMVCPLRNHGECAAHPRSRFENRGLWLAVLARVNTVADAIQIQPGNIEVSSIASRVSNGEVVSNPPPPTNPFVESQDTLWKFLNLRDCTMTVFFDSERELLNREFAVDHQGLSKLRIIRQRGRGIYVYMF